MVLFRVDLTGSDLGFTTRFRISMTELFITMNSFKITEGNENQCIYQLICDIQIIWKLSYLISLRIIVFELFEHWTMLIVFLFLYWLLPNFILEFPKHDWTSQLCSRNPVKSVLFICPTVWLSLMHFLQDLLSRFFWFFAWEYFAIYTKKWPSDNLFVV